MGITCHSCVLSLAAVQRTSVFVVPPSAGWLLLQPCQQSSSPDWLSARPEPFSKVQVDVVHCSPAPDQDLAGLAVHAQNVLMVFWAGRFYIGRVLSWKIAETFFHPHENWNAPVEATALLGSSVRGVYLLLKTAVPILRFECLWSWTLSRSVRFVSYYWVWPQQMILFHGAHCIQR